MAQVLSVIGVAMSGVALFVSIGSAHLSRRQVRLAESQHARDLRATVVAELIHFERSAEELRYTLSVTNTGPATARDVEVTLVEWTNESAIGRVIAEADVAPALLRGDQRIICLVLPVVDAHFDDRGVAVELSSAYYDDSGAPARNERLALVLEDTLIHLPPYG